MSVIGYLPAKSQLFIIRTLVDQLVLRLQRAQRVIVEFLEIVCVAQGGFFRLVVAAVVETLAVF